MRNGIRIGDIVNIFWVDWDNPTEAKILRKPCGPGDMLEVEHTDDGMIEAINCNSSAFECMQKVKEERK